LLLSNRLLGAVMTFGGVAAAVRLGITTFGGVAAAICLGWLLSAAGGDKMFGNRSSVCRSVCRLLWVCRLSLKRVTSCLLLL
jgi:hypothetical protein